MLSSTSAHQGRLLPLKKRSHLPGALQHATLRHVCSASVQSPFSALLPAWHALFGTASMSAHIQSPVRRSSHTAQLAWPGWSWPAAATTCCPGASCCPGMASDGQMLSIRSQLPPGVVFQCLRCRHTDVAFTLSSLHRSIADSTDAAPHAPTGTTSVPPPSTASTRMRPTPSACMWACASSSSWLTRPASLPASPGATRCPSLRCPFFRPRGPAMPATW